LKIKLLFIAISVILAITISSVALVGNLVAPSPLTTPGESSAPPQLTEDQRREAISVVLSDPFVGSILSKSNWTLVGLGAWVESGRVVGAALLVRLEEPAWVSGTFRELGGRSYRAKLWVGSLRVLVDLSARRVAAVSPGMARPPADPPEAVVDEAVRAVAAQKLGARPVLAGVFYTDEHPAGLAFFAATVKGKESVVAVDVARGVVVEKYSGEVARP